MKNKLQVKRHNRLRIGFTLIELMVTVAIIAILVALGIGVFSRAQRNARDAVRRAALRGLKTALEIYKLESGNYPSSSGCPASWCGEPPTYGNRTQCGGSGYIGNLCPNYFENLPRDPFWDPDAPTNPSGFSYIYRSDGANYKILAYGTVETMSSVPTNDNMYDKTCVLAPLDGCSAQPGARCQSFAVYTLGGMCW